MNCFEDNSFTRIVEIKSDLSKLDPCDLLNVFLEGCLERERGRLVYHTVYNGS